MTAKLPPRAVLNLTKAEMVKLSRVQKEWGWAYQEIFEYIVRKGLKELDLAKFPEEI